MFLESRREDKELWSEWQKALPELINHTNLNCIHVYKFNTEWNNVTKIINEQCNEPYKSDEIYSSNFEWNNVTKVIK
jgi:hypothetical protein